MAGKGRPKTGGRAKGTTNKLTSDVKAMVLEALDKAGGAAYLLNQAQTNPNAFMTLVGKVLPLQLTGDPENPVTVQSIERLIVKAATPAA